MFGLMVLLAAIVVFVLIIWVFAWMYRRMRNKGKSIKAALGWGFFAVWVFWLPMTWDAIPTWVAFQYHAHTKAGFKIYKTLDEWNVKNSGIASSLTAYNHRDSFLRGIHLNRNQTRYPLNERFAIDYETEPLFLSVRAYKESIVDMKTHEVLARWVAIRSGGTTTGGEGWWAFWLMYETSQDGHECFNAYRKLATYIGVMK